MSDGYNASVPRLSAIHTVSDKTVGLMEVNERFEIDADMLLLPEEKFFAALEKLTLGHLHFAVEKYKKRKWHWRSDLGVKLDRSELQFDLDLLDRLHGEEMIAPGQHQLKEKHNKIAYVVKFWVELEEARVGTIEEFDQPDEFEDAGMTPELPFEDHTAGKIVQLEGENNDE